MINEPLIEGRRGRSPVILLGGVSGTGKTTLGNILVRELGLSHHISTGFIRSAITPLLTQREAQLLQKHTYDAFEALDGTVAAGRSLLLEGAIQQSLLLKPAIESCITRAIREGIGLVMEGSHFIPGVLEFTAARADLLCILDVPDREALRFRALSPNHSRRKLSDPQLCRLFQLQDEILYLARLHNQSVIINDDLSQAVERIIALVGPDD